MTKSVLLDSLRYNLDKYLENKGVSGTDEFFYRASMDFTTLVGKYYSQRERGMITDQELQNSMQGVLSEIMDGVIGASK